MTAKIIANAASHFGRVAAEGVLHSQEGQKAILGVAANLEGRSFALEFGHGVTAPAPGL